MTGARLEEVILSLREDEMMTIRLARNCSSGVGEDGLKPQEDSKRKTLDRAGLCTLLAFVRQRHRLRSKRTLRHNFQGGCVKACDLFVPL